MHLGQAVAISMLFLAGVGLGWLLSIWAVAVPRSALQLLGGTLAVLLFTWPVYRRLGWLPPPPKCPRQGCGARAYTLVSTDRRKIKWQCTQCGQLLLLEGDAVAMLSETDEPVGYLRLMWPGFLGFWKQLPS
jgi:hypothetical protein